MATLYPDMSLVKDLSPNYSMDFAYKRFKNSLRYHGSHILNLQRPNRLGVYSRPYTKGDPPNLIDWKVFARSDTLLIRQQQDEASAKIRIVIDCGQTMQWPDADASQVLSDNPITKQELAMRIALNLAYIHLHLGDAVKVQLNLGDLQNHHYLFWLPSASSVLNLFENLKAKNFSLEALIAEAREVIQPRSDADICYWLSDGLGNEDMSASKQTARIFKFIHILSSYELGSDWMDGELSYFDQSPTPTREYLGLALRHHHNYSHQIRKWLDGFERRLKAEGHAYQLVTERTSIKAFHDQLPEL